uniref:Uncharacterized protein n=1 Tax=Schizaphis graminum TaxID=13262 RepID=A0A2S2NL15_SCHGA
MINDATTKGEYYGEKTHPAQFYYYHYYFLPAARSTAAAAPRKSIIDQHQCHRFPRRSPLFVFSLLSFFVPAMFIYIYVQVAIIIVVESPGNTRRVRITFLYNIYTFFFR